jgi:hypothetical protein
VSEQLDGFARADTAVVDDTVRVQRGLADFRPVPQAKAGRAYAALVLAFDSIAERVALIETLGLAVERIDGSYGAYYPRDSSGDGQLFDGTEYATELPSALLVEPSPPPALPVEWRGMPRFEPLPERLTFLVACSSEATRDELAGELGLVVSKKTNGTWSCWWPPRDREDLSALRFDLASAVRVATFHTRTGRVELVCGACGEVFLADPSDSELACVCGFVAAVAA